MQKRPTSSVMIFGAILFVVSLVAFMVTALRAEERSIANDGAMDAFVPVILAEMGGTAAPPTATSEAATSTATATSTPTQTPTTTSTETPTPTATPTETPTLQPKVTATNTPRPTRTPLPGRELLVLDWNKLVEEKHSGFPWDKPPLAAANGDWTYPVNFAEGTMYFRAELRKMPSEKKMLLEFCAWQYSNTLENCSVRQAVSYEGKKVVVTWSQPVKNFWKKAGLSIDWANPRDRYGIAIRNTDKEPVSNYNDWNWSGEDPKQWYPMDLRFTAVVVEKGAGFSGWDKYTNATP